jgi:uncharacterized repeat protein (TIGR03809 family)
MTTSFDAERYQRALERWRVLAERRLEHMTVLYESGRWRRYFSEEKFIGIVRETRTAVETWRRIVPEHEAVAQMFAMAEERPLAAAEPRLPAFAVADERPVVVSKPQPPASAIADERPVVVSEPQPPAFAIADEWPFVASERRPPAFAIADEQPLVVAEPPPPPPSFATPLPDLRL